VARQPELAFSAITSNDSGPSSTRIDRSVVRHFTTFVARCAGAASTAST
jgi:hypothetical protein